MVVVRINVYIALISSCVWLAGCASSPRSRPTINDIANVTAMRISKERANAEMEMVAPDCSNPTIKAPGGFQFTPIDCGLLYDTLIANGSLKKEICPALKLKNSACTNVVMKTYSARLIDRYPHADTDLINHECESDPVYCRSNRNKEILMINSHNTFVQTSFFEKSNHIVEEGIAQQQKAQDTEEAESARRHQAIAQALHGIGSSLRNPPRTETSCVSRRGFDGSVVTDCH